MELSFFMSYPKKDFEEKYLRWNTRSVVFNERRASKRISELWAYSIRHDNILGNIHVFMRL